MNYIITIILFILCNVKGYTQDWRYVPGKKVYKNLEEAGLQALPGSIGKLRSLERLDLNGNCLTVLPDEVGELKSLTFLDASQNKLTSLAFFIGDLPGLKHLYLGNNNITHFSNKFIYCTYQQMLL